MFYILAFLNFEPKFWILFFKIERGPKKFGHPCLINSFELDFEKRRGEILKIVIEKYSNEDALEHYGRSINELNSFQY